MKEELGDHLFYEGALRIALGWEDIADGVPADFGFAMNGLALPYGTYSKEDLGVLEDVGYILGMLTGILESGDALNTLPELGATSAPINMGHAGVVEIGISR